MKKVNLIIHGALGDLVWKAVWKGIWVGVHEPMTKHINAQCCYSTTKTVEETVEGVIWGQLGALNTQIENHFNQPR